MKTQMKFQKKLCLIMLILGALSVVLALFYTTGVLAGFGSTLYVQSKNGVRGYYPDPDFEEGGQLFLDMQSFNNMLLYLGIVLVLAAAVLYITGTQSRRNYYVSNYVASIVVAALFIVIAIVVMVMNASWLSQVQTILADTDAMDMYKEIAIDDSVYYSENTAMFIVCFVVEILNIIGAAALIFNLVWKCKLMKGEKALLEQGTMKEVA